MEIFLSFLPGGRFGRAGIEAIAMTLFFIIYVR